MAMQDFVYAREAEADTKAEAIQRRDKEAKSDKKERMRQ